MKKNIITIIILFSIYYSCKSTKEVEIDSKNFFLKDLTFEKTNIDHGKLKESDLIQFKNYLKSNFEKDLDSIKYLTISYYKPISDCWYDSYSWIKREKTSSILDNLKKKLNSDLLIAHYESKYTSPNSMIDHKGLIYKLFSRGIQACDFTVTINNYGNYIFKASHFSVKASNAFRNELKRYDDNYHNSQ
ncbi:hypothetical protein D7030_01850 [Flavobacteriaceae bacterium AU392]|nr:hypothetical protein D1817_08325 [Flavobacteriaceae bacterium]RKM85439.1 hypothetical protein D7030_01850 [Flavobacteriaceae bacterium AU392]